MKNKVLGIVTARGGSKGLPGKNIKRLINYPLISWTINASLKSVYTTETIVSTDDEEIAEISRKCGATVPFMRPSKLGLDNTPHFDVIKHSIDWYFRENNGTLPDYISILQPTSPFRTSKDIDNAYKILLNKNADGIIGVTKPSQHPYNMNKIDKNGILKPFNTKKNKYLRRQDLPPIFIKNGAIYIIKTNIFIKEKKCVPNKSIPFIMPKWKSIDIDDIDDFIMAEAIGKKYRKELTKEFSF